ncbi:uncharacterized protein LOC111103278 isoform X2 [Crassostrea virginica]
MENCKHYSKTLAFFTILFYGVKCCRRNGLHGIICCEHYMLVETTNTCKPCPPGYTGASCSTPCPSPSYGLRCQYLCQTCSTSSCHHVKGCPEFKLPHYRYGKLEITKHPDSEGSSTVHRSFHEERQHGHFLMRNDRQKLKDEPKLNKCIRNTRKE